MRKIVVDKAYVYSVGYDVALIILDIVYGIDDKIKVMYTIGEKIIGNVTTKKVYYTVKGAYIVYFGRRVYLNEFLPVDFYGMEFVGGRK